MKVNENSRNNETRMYFILFGYPIALTLISVLLNIFIFNVNPYIVSLPSVDTISSIVLAAVLLTINHTWIMTATEIVRAKYKIYSSPEEWRKNGINEHNVKEEGIKELKRHHDTHLNTTENTIYFALLIIPFILVSPPILAATVWIVGYAIGRLGYTYGFLYGKDAVRGLFMSISLLTMYGMATYLIVGLFL